MADAMKQVVSMEKIRQVRDQVKSEMQKEREQPKLEVIEGGRETAERAAKEAAADVEAEARAFANLQEDIDRIKTVETQVVNTLRSEVKTGLESGQIDIEALRQKIESLEKDVKDRVYAEAPTSLHAARIPEIKGIQLTKEMEIPTEPEPGLETRALSNEAEAPTVLEPYEEGEKTTVSDKTEVSEFKSLKSAHEPSGETLVPVEEKPAQKIGDLTTSVREIYQPAAVTKPLKTTGFTPTSELPTAAPFTRSAERPTEIIEDQVETAEMLERSNIDPINVTKLEAAMNNLNAYSDTLDFVSRIPANQDIRTINATGETKAFIDRMIEEVDATREAAKNDPTIKPYTVQELAGAWLAAYQEQGNEAAAALAKLDLGTNEVQKKERDRLLKSWADASGAEITPAERVQKAA